MKTTISLTMLSLIVVIGGCGGAPISRELRTARDTMSAARASAAARFEADQLRAAERSLARAEAAPDGSFLERDLAYVADRQARIAVVNARREANRLLLVEQRRQYQTQLERVARDRQRALEVQQLELAEVQRELGRVRGELSQQGQALGQQTEELQRLEQELAAREQQLLESERRAGEAMGRLAELANIRREHDRTVITLSGEVLFETGRAELRPTARERLNSVAEALQAQPDMRIIVEGHTDQRGRDEANRLLSQRRAEAVRSFLLDRGIESDRIIAVGRGESDPIADNDTPEGRAENRRVEIELTPTTEARVSLR